MARHCSVHNRPARKGRDDCLHYVAELGASEDYGCVVVEHGTCGRDDCDMTTVNDEVCWWCRNEDAGTYLARK